MSRAVAPGRVRMACGVAALALAGSGALLAATPAPPQARARALSAAPAPAPTSAPPAAHPIQLVLPLSADLPGLEQLAAAVGTPGSSSYGRYEPVAELARRFGAPTGTRARVLAYLRRVGATGVTVDVTGLFAVATLSTRRAEGLFATPLRQFRSADGTHFIAPSARVTLPRALRGLVTGVVGLDTRATASPRPPAHGAIGRTAAAGQLSSGYEPVTGTRSGCSQAMRTGGFTPGQYLTAYGFDPLHTSGLKGDGERVALIEVDGFKRSDILTFGRCFGIAVPRINAFGAGGLSHPLPPGPEATLDLEVLDAAAPGLRAIDVYEAPSDAVGTLEAFTAPLRNPGFKAQVISASLGLCEPSIVGSLGASGIRTAEAELALAAAGGITVLAASGDTGSADCVRGDGTPRASLAVNYPASSPWVTGVGGTNLDLSSANTINGEIVWNDTAAQPGSAGGGGTSAATPLLAGGLALVDQLLRERGRADLGRVNPLLYNIGRSPALATQVFNDVTEFGNDVGPYIPGDHQPLGCCPAAPGYDEASGWGSVNLAKLATVALLVQPRAATVHLSLPRHQSPAARGGILATISCSDPCTMGAFAQVAIGHGAHFTLHSRTYRLSSAGRKTIALRFSRLQLGRLASALAHRRGVLATVFGVTFDARGVVQQETAGTVLAIHG